MARPEVFSYWPSYRSEVSCSDWSQMLWYWLSYRFAFSGIGPTQSVFVSAQLQDQGQCHLPEPKQFRNGPVTGPRSAAFA